MTAIIKNEKRLNSNLSRSLFLYLGYLTVFFATWFFNKIDYTRIGENSQTVKLWFALPTLLGSIFLIISITKFKWWNELIFEKEKKGSRALWLLIITYFIIIIYNFSKIPMKEVNIELLTWVAIGSMGVGFGEEMITRGSMTVALRKNHSEVFACIASTAFFSALHFPNIFFGLPLLAMPIQLILTFIFGSGMFLIRRVSGSIILPMIIHGLWDGSLFLSQATNIQTSNLQFIAYPISIIFLIFFIVHEKKLKK